MHAFDAWESSGDGNYLELIFGHGLPHWFVNQAQSWYQWNWRSIFLSLVSGSFFSSNSYFSNESITGEYLSEPQAKRLGRNVIAKLVAIAATLSTGDEVTRSLELDGFTVDRDRVALVPIQSAVSADEQTDLLTSQVRSAGLPNVATVLKHIEDARDSFAQGRNHPSLNESRSLIQPLIDSISEETHKSNVHAVALPSGTANRIDYLEAVGFLTVDEKAAYRSGWGTLSAGSHPGVPEKEQARIGLILALELAQLLILKYENWKRNGYPAFS